MIEIVLPCYNPPDNWYKELLAFHHFVKPYEEVRYTIVNDGSTNQELENALPILEKAGVAVKLIAYSENKGKGFALRQGVAACKDDFVIYTDIDFPFNNESILNIIHQIKENKFDVLAGSRDKKYYTNKMSFFRKLLSKSFRFFLKNILHMKVTDTQCGIKAFSKRGKEVFLKTKINRYLFDFEFIYACSKNNSISVQPVNVELKPNVVFRKMKLKILIQESMNLLRVILFS